MYIFDVYESDNLSLDCDSHSGPMDSTESQTEYLDTLLFVSRYSAARNSGKGQNYRPPVLTCLSVSTECGLDVGTEAAQMLADQ